MANEFIIRKGFIAKDDSVVSGSFIVTDNITASAFSGDGSGLTGVTADSSALVTTQSFYEFTASYTTASFTGSFIGDGSGLVDLNIPDLLISQSSTFLGSGSGLLEQNTQFGANTAFGYRALRLISTGVRNTSVGSSAGANATVGYDNVAIGYSALANTDTSNNVAVGTQALLSLVSLGNNTGVGSNALGSLAVGGNNTVVGSGATNSLQSGSNNTMLGEGAVSAITSGSDNIAIGVDAGIVDRSGANVLKLDQCILIGPSSVPSSSNDINEIIIGADAQGEGNNTTVIGNSSITNTYIEGITTVRSNTFNIQNSNTPSSTADTSGNIGDLNWDDSFIYVKTSAGWKRSALSTF